MSDINLNENTPENHTVSSEEASQNANPAAPVYSGVDRTDDTTPVAETPTSNWFDEPKEDAVTPDPTSVPSDTPTDISTPTEDGTLSTLGTEPEPGSDEWARLNPAPGFENPPVSDASEITSDGIVSTPEDNSDVNPGVVDAPEPEVEVSESPTPQADPDSTRVTDGDNSGLIPEDTVLPDGITVTQVDPELNDPPVPEPREVLSDKEIEHRFGFHRATIEGPESSNQIHTELRINFKGFVKGLNRRLPFSREAVLAMNALEEASMWAHKAIAKDDPLEEEAPEIITQEESDNRVGLATLNALKLEAQTNPFVHDQLASVGLI